MKKRPSLLLVLGVTVVLLAFGMVALAADTAAKPPAKAVKTAPTAPAAKAGKAANEVKCVVSGKVESTMVKNKRDKEVKVCRIQVSEAKGADGKAMDALKGVSLKVTGPKLADVQKLVGKNAELTGVVIDGKRIRVESVK